MGVWNSSHELVDGSVLCASICNMLSQSYVATLFKSNDYALFFYPVIASIPSCMHEILAWLFERSPSKLRANFCGFEVPIVLNYYSLMEFNKFLFSSTLDRQCCINEHVLSSWLTCRK